MTIRIITANLDPSSLSEYSRIPSLFGGAGSGCIAEVLFFNPSEKYLSPMEREEYAAACAAKLRQQGVLPYQMQLTEQPEKGTVLTATQI